MIWEDLPAGEGEGEGEGDGDGVEDGGMGRLSFGGFAVVLVLGAELLGGVKLLLEVLLLGLLFGGGGGLGDEGLFGLLLRGCGGGGGL